MDRPPAGVHVPFEEAAASWKKQTSHLGDSGITQLRRRGKERDREKRRKEQKVKQRRGERGGVGGEVWGNSNVREL